MERETRTVVVTNLQGEEVRLTIVGAIVVHVQPVRREPTMESRRQMERRERACVDCPPIA